MAATYWMEVSQVLAESPGARAMVEKAGLHPVPALVAAGIATPVYLWKVFDGKAPIEMNGQLVNPVFQITDADGIGNQEITIIDRKVVENV